MVHAQGLRSIARRDTFKVSADSLQCDEGLRFNKDCVAQCENIFLVDKDSLDPNTIGVLDEMTLRDVVRAIGHVIDSDCEPN